MADEPRQITQGLLDGLILTPVGPHGQAPTFLDIKVRDLPGFRAALDIEAVREVQDALNVLLGPRATPELASLVRAMFEVYDRPCEPNGDWNHSTEYRELEAKARALVGAPPRKDR